METNEPEAIGTIEKRESLEKPPQTSKYWLAELNASDKREENWRKKAEKVIAKYRDEGNKDFYAGDQREKKVNILWANTEVLKAALFAHLGNPDVRRAFPLPGHDQKVARTTALVLERNLEVCSQHYDADAQIERAVEDMLLPGRGQIWLEYEPYLDGEGYVSRNLIRICHVPWEQYREGLSKSWKDMPWVARCDYYTRDDLENHWPKHASAIPMNHSIGPEDRKAPDLFKRAKVWEIWDKKREQRHYVAEDYEWILQTDDDPYQLEDFFPCPEPVLAVSTTNSRVPVPEYCLYQDQADELDRITTRIARLTEGLKRRGLYDGTEESGALADLAYADDNQYIPYKGFAELLQKGGLAAVFLTEDIAPTAKILDSLHQQRHMLIQTIYEVTGISDIVRGATDPRETKGAQQLKAQFGSQRLQKRQRSVQQFVSDIYKLKGELIAQFYTREELQNNSGVLLPLQEEQQRAQQVMGQYQQAVAQAQQMGQQPPQVPEETQEKVKNLLDAISWEEIEPIFRSDERRNYKIQIETDSTVFQDEQAEKQSRMEYLTTMRDFLREGLPAIQANPSVGPLVKEMILFASRSFKVGRNLEETLEDAFEQIQNQPPQPNPDVEKAKMDAQLQQQKAQIEGQSKQQEHQLKMADLQAEMQRDREKHQAEMQKIMLEVNAMREKLGMEMQKAEMDLVVDMEKAELDRESRIVDFNLKQQEARGNA